MQLFVRWLVTILCLLAVIATLGFIKYTQVQAAIAFGESFPETNETVEATNVNWTKWQPYVDLVGEIKAQQVVEVRNELEGIVTKVGFESGGAVKQGQVLLQFNIDEESAQLEALRAEIDLAKLDVKRFTDLLDARASSRDQLDRAKAQLAIAEARAKAIEATIAKKTLIAPFDGHSNIHDWQTGAYLSGNTLVTQITGDLEKVWVDFNIPQTYADMDTQKPIQVVSKAKATFDADIIALNQQFTDASRSIQARAVLNNPNKQLRPGTVITVRIPQGQAINVIKLPNPAIRYDAFGSYVNVLNKDEKGDYRASRKPVVVVSKQSEFSYVSSGIDANDLVATVGSAKLTPNMLTNIAN